MESIELEKSKAVIIVEIIEYVPNAVLSKTILKKSTGNVSVMSFDSGEGLTTRCCLLRRFHCLIGILRPPFEAHIRGFIEDITRY